MTSQANHFSPDTIAKPAGYSHVVEITGPARMVFIAGQLGLKPDGSMAGGVGDFAAQAEQAIQNLKAALAAVGGGLEHIVKITNYLTDIAHLPLFRAARDRHFKNGAPPASTTLAIAALARPDALFEIEAVAMLPPR
jgi:enamine deaminase RidA (YjgF/YER057c/UK114 family)